MLTQRYPHVLKCSTFYISHVDVQRQLSNGITVSQCWTNNLVMLSGVQSLKFYLNYCSYWYFAERNETERNR